MLRFVGERVAAVVLGREHAVVTPDQGGLGQGAVEIRQVTIDRGFLALFDGEDLIEFRHDGVLCLSLIGRRAYMYLKVQSSLEPCGSHADVIARRERPQADWTRGDVYAPWQCRGHSVRNSSIRSPSIPVGGPEALATGT